MFASTAFSHFRFGTFCLALLALLAAHTVSAQTTYTISGQVNKGASPLAGVTMTLGGSQTGTATTNSSGDYSFTAPSGGNYTVTPSLAG
jgi:heme A synthase